MSTQFQNKTSDFHVLTYRGKALEDMSADELRGVVDNMAHVYRNRIQEIKEALDGDTLDRLRKRGLL